MWLAFGTQSWELRDGETVVGSGADADWRIPTADLVPRHFTITTYDLNASLKPASRDAVVVVNDKQLQETDEHILHDGDVIAAGAGRFLFCEEELRDVPPAPFRAESAYLIGGTRQLTQELVNRSTTFGRDASSNFLLRDPSVSRFHAEVRREAGGFALHSMGASGTWLNGRRIDAPMLLKEGDSIQIAKSRWRFTYQPSAVALGIREAPGPRPDRRASAADTTRIQVVVDEPPTSRRLLVKVAAGVAVIASLTALAVLIFG